jgi:hypothetical protein
MADRANWFVTPGAHHVQVATANTARDGTGTLGTGPAGVAGGRRIVRAIAIATGNTTAGMVRVFRSLDGGTTKRLFAEIQVVAVTVSATVMAFAGELPVLPGTILRDANDILYVSTHNAETFNVFFEYLDQ